MKKAELLAAIAEKTGSTKKDAEATLNAVIGTIIEALEAGDKVAVPGFGTFEVRDRAAKDSKNPRTGEVIHVEAKKVPAFKAAKALKDIVDKK